MNAAVTVREMMDREYVGVSESDDLVDTVELLLREEAEAAVVQRGSEHVGIVTERDILALLVEGPDPGDATVEDAMTESVPTIEPEASLESAADMMSTRSTGRLLVANGTEPLGFLTERDLLATRTHERKEIESGVQDSEAVAMTAQGVTAETAQEDHFDNQGICEACGKLAQGLAGVNGQVLCSDCREM
jgi:CBS domain-containing protein